jgi:hypothetical protein
MKGGVEIMAQQLNSRGVLSLRAADSFMASFRQIFAFFCVLLTDSCILLFFHISASKPRLLLITNKTPIFRKSKPNPAEKYFLWRYGDTKIFLRSKYSYKNDDYFQPLQTSFAPFPCEAGEGLGMGDAVTSRRQGLGMGYDFGSL